MSELVELRRQFHRIPEVGLHLPQTQALVLEALEGLPLEITLGKSLSSVVAVLRGGRATDGKRPVVLLRGDMDALPVQEATGLDFASTNGNMHACGHDLHMTMLIGAARELSARRDELAGDVVFMFQPGEEMVDGASYMLDEGVLDAAGARPDAAYAIHVWAGMEPHGTFTTKPGTTMASHDVVRVRYVGKGGHGSVPHTAVDPVPPIAELVTASHAMVTRQFDAFEPVVVTIGRLSAGTAANVIPEYAELDASIRTFSPESREKVIARLERLARGIADAHGVECELTNPQSYPPTVNDHAEADFVGAMVSELFGDERHVRWENSLTSSEDFSRVLQEVPGCFFGLSACPPDADPATVPFNHSAYAVFDDAVLEDGVRVFTELTLRKLAG
ncbi:M20 metallopeptidase family protein [Tessaracoccus oleiagri]|uniref:Hippurate hydrolase n=1 Tax=Tessaracoccus oleiagri TaxID=686624 RepID=A0A1G9N2Q1_9ACTN|nr:M20 family metallopeptidase [Tessaracoccus oleiagri]SDL80768.1 hippurate hydrolase [Tessaracoccus oleiagri]